MSFKLKRSAAVLAMLTIATTALVGCSAPVSGAKVSELTIWAAQSTPDSVKSVIHDYEAKSGVKINLTVIPDSFESNTLTKWAAGQRPDIIFFQPSPGFLSQLNPSKNLQDLGHLPFATETKFGLEGSGALNGTHYTATYGFPSVFGVFYNKKVFADNGINVPKTPADLDAAAVTLKAAGVTPFGITGGDSWTGQIGFISALTDTVADGGAKAINDGTEKFTEAPFVEAASVNPKRVSKQWVNDDYLTALYADVPKKLQDGDFAMYPMASWLSASFTDASKIGFFPYPSSSGKVQWQSSNNASVQLPKTGDSAKEAAARDFVNYLTVGNGYKALIAASGEPSIIKGVDDPAAITPLAKAAADAFAAGGAASLDQQLLYSPSERATLLGSVLAGTLTPKEFGAQYQDAFDKLKALQGN